MRVPHQASADWLRPLWEREAAMIDSTCRLAELPSGSLHRAGTDATLEAFAQLFSPWAETLERRTLAPIVRIGDGGETKEFQPSPMLILRRRPQAPLQLLCTGHYDTVFPSASTFTRCWREGDHLRGPGVADMKGGLVVLCEALAAFERCPDSSGVGITVALSPDEEIGSPSSAVVLAELARHAHVGLTYEPALADGTLAGARKGSGNFALVVEGRSAHAGRDFFTGRNAVSAAARLALALEALSDESSGITVNVGAITGGGPVNVVPARAVCHLNLRCHNDEQQRYLEIALQETIRRVGRETDCAIHCHGGFNRPPKPHTPAQQALGEVLRRCGDALGIAVAFKATGGCCEGNNLAAAGLVNIDTLGVRGGEIHSEAEFACIDSFVERAALSAWFMAALARGAYAGGRP